MTRGIILSGGWGTRLRPLTCTIPKTLIPIVNIPVIERQILLLKEAGVKEVVLAVSVMGEQLQKYFKNGEKLGVEISYTEEKSPMGTAGAIKLAEKKLKGDNFFMLNGDVILDFNFKKMLDAHEKFDGIGTIASKNVDDPSRYGVLITDEKGRILKFQEKEEFNPSEQDASSMPINAGVYILEPEVFSYIPPKKKVSIEREVFPKLAEDKQLQHHPISGLWKDVGKPNELFDGNIKLLNDLIEREGDKKHNIIGKNVDIHPTATIHHPIALGNNSIIGKNSEIGPNVIIGDNVFIEENCSIKEALIFNEVYIEKNTEIEKTIIADNALIKEGAKLQGYDDQLVILASYVQVLEDIKLIATKRYPISFCHHEVVKESIE
jgi:mannose-1-phosphate guanylyltransferase/phosphomannomutase